MLEHVVARAPTLVGVLVGVLANKECCWRGNGKHPIEIFALAMDLHSDEWKKTHRGLVRRDSKQKSCEFAVIAKDGYCDYFERGSSSDQ